MNPTITVDGESFELSSPLVWSGPPSGIAPIGPVDQIEAVSGSFTIEFVPGPRFASPTPEQRSKLHRAAVAEGRAWGLPMPSQEEAQAGFWLLAPRLSATELQAVQWRLRAGRLFGADPDHCFFGIVGQARGGRYGDVPWMDGRVAFEAWIVKFFHFGDTPATSAEAAALDAWLTEAIAHKKLASLGRRALATLIEFRRANVARPTMVMPPLIDPIRPRNLKSRRWTIAERARRWRTRKAMRN